MLYAEDRLHIEQIEHLIDKVSTLDPSKPPSQAKKQCVALLVCKVNHMSDQITLLPQGRRAKLVKCLQETMEKHGRCFDEKMHRMMMKIIEDDSIRQKASNVSSNTIESSNTLAVEPIVTAETSKDPSPTGQPNHLETFSQGKLSDSKKSSCGDNKTSQVPRSTTASSKTGRKDFLESEAREKTAKAVQSLRSEIKCTSCRNCKRASQRKFSSIGYVRKFIEPVVRRKPCSEITFAAERQQAPSNKQAPQLSSGAERFKRVKAETFHIFASEQIMFFEEQNCGRFIKKTMAIPRKYFGRILGIKGTTVRILELLTNTIISIKQPPTTNYWRYLVAAGRCHFEVNNLISLIHFLLKYNIDFDIKAISTICSKLGSLETDRNNSLCRSSGSKDQRDGSRRKAPEKQSNSEGDDLATASLGHSTDEETKSIPNKGSDLSTSHPREKANICSCAANKRKVSSRIRRSGPICMFLTDSVQVRNSHVGRIMGTKGSIIAIIEHFTNTVISFKDMPEAEGNRMVCIKGQSQKDIDCAKEFIHLIIFHSIRFGLLTDQLVSRASDSTEKQPKSMEDKAYEISFTDVRRIPDREWLPNGIKQLVRSILSKEEASQWNCAKCVYFQMPCSKEVQRDGKTTFRRNGQNKWEENVVEISVNKDAQGNDLVQPEDHSQAIAHRKSEEGGGSLKHGSANSIATVAQGPTVAPQTSKALPVFSGNGCNQKNTSIAQREQFLLAEMTTDAIMPFNEYWESKCSELGISRGRGLDNPFP